MHPIGKIALLLLTSLWSYETFAGPIIRPPSNPKNDDKVGGRHKQKFLSFKGTPRHTIVQGGVKLRILPVGASITVGYERGEEGDGYRERLRDNLSLNKVVWAGTERSPEGDMKDGFFAAWSGKTIQYMDNRIEPSLEQRPNLILVDTGTNDMNNNQNIATEGNDPGAAIERLRLMVEDMVDKCPDATIILGMPINVCNKKEFHEQRKRIMTYRSLVAELAGEFKGENHHVLAADFGPFKESYLGDCVHPEDTGYLVMGNWWYDFIHQIPEGWIKEPVGPDPVRDGTGV
ncbi:SGNH hydrolase-type esterase domain-containing protein [Fusarium acuminatum]|uniref:SGNH hydrolase-type esterase domain-containing protein n=1 Tax=Fusarium acuminatum TaxID=5515 RepID=A0ABZ2WQ51_9HYPO